MSRDIEHEEPVRLKDLSLPLKVGFWFSMIYGTMMVVAFLVGFFSAAVKP